MYLQSLNQHFHEKKLAQSVVQKKIEKLRSMCGTQFFMQSFKADQFYNYVIIFHYFILNTLGSPILIVVSVICRDQCIYYLYYVILY